MVDKEIHATNQELILAPTDAYPLSSTVSRYLLTAELLLKTAVFSSNNYGSYHPVRHRVDFSGTSLRFLGNLYRQICWISRLSQYAEFACQLSAGTIEREP